MSSLARFVFRCLCIVPLLFLSGTLSAQTAPASLQGKVLDESGAAVKDAKVSLIPRRFATTEPAITREDGTFSFPRLDPGDYRLTVFRAGFATQTREITIDSGQDKTFDIRLSISATSESVTVVGDVEDYHVEVAASAARLNAPLRDIPQAVQVINRQLLNEQQVLRMSELIQDIPGVNRFPGLGMLEDEWGVRGFQTVGNLFYKDGFRDPATILRDTANIERVEVLKGANSVAYGRGDPSGLINLITKKPLPDNLLDVNLTFGSFGLTRIAPDISGPLNASKTLTYRFNAALERADSFKNYVHSNRQFYAPALSWKVNRKTRLFFDGEYLLSRAPLDRGTVSLNGKTDVVPIENFYGEPSFRITSRYYRVLYGAEQQFNRNWSARVAGQNGFASFRGNSAEGASIAPDNRAYRRTFRFRDYRDPFKYVQADVTGTVAFAGLRHQIVFGTDDGVDSKYSGDHQRSNATRFPYAIDLFHPVFGALPLPPFASITRITNSTSDSSFYATDLITLATQFKLLLGGRYDSYSANSEDTLIGRKSAVNKQGHALTSRAGLVWQPTETLSFYANTAQSFKPQTGVNAQGGLFEPERGRQYEVGAKGNFAGGRLNATLAAYNIRKRNVLTGDLLNAGFSIQTGEQRSRGIELDMNGRITNHWRFLTTYALTKAQVTRDNTIPVGSLLYNVPRNSGSVWSLYDFDRGTLKGFTVGAGVAAYSKRAANSINDVYLPSYARVDLTAMYRKGRYRFNLRVENLLNQDYYPGANTFSYWLITGTPINVRGGLDIRFF